MPPVLPGPEPLVLAKVGLAYITEADHLFGHDYVQEARIYDEPIYQPRKLWVPMGQEDQSQFNAWYAAPKTDKNGSLPLVVYIHGGPFIAEVKRNSRFMHFAIANKVAYLAVNYRGSTGMGDESLQAIIGNMGEVRIIGHVNM